MKKNLKKEEQNEKLLKDEGFLNLKNGTEGKEETMFDKGIKEHELKTVETKIKNLKEKIQETDDKIYAIVQDIEPMTMKEKRKLYLENFEKEIKNIKEKIQETDDKIYAIVQDIEPMSMKEKRKLYLENFERERQIAETRAKKYFR